MPYTRPTLATINTRIDGDITASVSTTSPLLPRSVLRVLSKVFAAAIHLLYGFAQWMSRQIFPDTADAENLERWASVWDVSRVQATYASFNITVTGVDDSVIPTGTRWVSTDLIEYESATDATISGGTATLEVTAVTPGEIGNVLDGQILNLTSPITGVVSEATVSSTPVDGIDAETDESLLARLKARIQLPPHGGNKNDYVTWAKENPDYRVTRAWAYENWGGPGNVGVTFLMDAEVDPVPPAPAIASVLAYINERRPLCATVAVFAPTPVTVDFTIALTPNTGAVKVAVQDALTAHLAEAGYPEATLYLSKLNEAISSALGEEDHVMSVPAANIVLAVNEFAQMGTITWA